MARTISTSSSNLQQEIPLPLDIHPIIPSVTSFWINDQENIPSPTSSHSISNSSTVMAKLDKQRAAYKSCETKLKRMMMEDENYSFILNPCCDKIDCKFVKNAILKDCRSSRNVSRDSVEASIISIDSEAEDVGFSKLNESFLVAPLRTRSVEEEMKVEPIESNEDKQSNFKGLFEELNSSISQNLQAQFDERLTKLRQIIKGRKNRKTKI
ncbi:hypothetical protein I9W82_001648 [Candida metapsilosis]|uniref:Uncharacterized protein n=1 Tax=Candida metapsilosis TaxID=273372 RepID=A0A8H8DAX3_9ASCO|nr:hypothetical protein I9W82_001648 [Candida metapsilosis]